MWTMNMRDILLHLSNLNGLVPAALVTAAVAVLVGCAVGCCRRPEKEKDTIFHREVM